MKSLKSYLRNGWLIRAISYRNSDGVFMIYVKKNDKVKVLFQKTMPKFNIHHIDENAAAYDEHYGVKICIHCLLNW